MKYNKLNTIILALLLFTGILLIAANQETVVSLDNYLNNQELSKSSTNSTIINPVPKVDKKVTLMFVGDIMLSRSVGDKMKNLDEWRWPFLKIADTLNSADLTFGNLESPISDRGRNVGSIYSFRADPRVIQGLNFAGFDLVTVANNHIGDWTRQAMEDTFTYLENANIAYTGGGFNEEQAHTATIKEIKGTKFGFLGYTAIGSKYTLAQGDTSGIAWLEMERLKTDISNASKTADFIIVNMHAGEEYQPHSNAYQQKYARLAIDAGAKLVIGHHPHVIQEIEEYHGGYIAYSLGNFIFDQTFSQETMEGLLLKVTVENGEIQTIEPIKIDISKDFQAYIKESS